MSTVGYRIPISTMHTVNQVSLKALPRKDFPGEQCLTSLAKMYTYVFFCGFCMFLGGVLTNSNWYNDIFLRPDTALWTYLVATTMFGFSGLAGYSWCTLWKKQQEAKNNYRQAIASRIHNCTYDQLKTEIQAHPKWLKYVGNPVQEIALAAIQQNADLILTVDHIDDEAFCCRAIKSNERVMNVLSKKQQTKSVWETAVNMNWIWLRSCPKKYQDFELCLSAAQQCEKAVEYIQNYQIQKQVRKALKAEKEQKSTPASSGCNISAKDVREW